MYDRILVPTDGSSGVERAIHHAIELARAHDATLHTVFVVNSATFASLPMETSWEGLNDMLWREGEEAIARVESLATTAEIPVTSTILEGTPSRQIVAYAVESNCDLIVMGTRGRGGIDRLLLGSVAERVVRSSPVPVLTVSVDTEI